MTMTKENSPAEVLLKLDGVKKVFFTDELETHALADVHLQIKRGEYVAIEGPSGSGKTTLLSILGLLDVPSAGEYVLRDRRVSGLSARERARNVFEQGRPSGLRSGWQCADHHVVPDRHVHEQSVRDRLEPAAHQVAGHGVAHGLRDDEPEPRRTARPGVTDHGYDDVRRGALASTAHDGPVVVPADDPVGAGQHARYRRAVRERTGRREVGRWSIRRCSIRR